MKALGEWRTRVCRARLRGRRGVPSGRGRRGRRIRVGRVAQAEDARMGGRRLLSVEVLEVLVDSRERAQHAVDVVAGCGAYDLLA